MIRLAQHCDASRIAEMMLQLKQHTGWARVHNPGYNLPALTQYVAERLLDESSVVYVCGSGNDVVAFCGCSLGWLPWPPHSLTLVEWGWFGPAKEAAQCWRACTNWGKKRGVEYAGRVSGQPGTSDTRAVETVTWEVL